VTGISGKSLDEQLAKAVVEIQRLQNDIAKLDAKIEPFDKRHRYDKGYDRGEVGRDKSSEDAFGRLTDIRNAIRGCEAHIGKVRTQLDDMAEHAASRDAMKPYLKKKN
jgi:predicted  nucleic acid-binding Zn-ribbon protein